MFPFLSSTGNSGLIDDPEFKREDEKKDERVDRIVAMIKANHDWKQFVWEVEPLPRSMLLSDSEEEAQGEDVTEPPPVIVETPTVSTKRAKRKLNDPGAESRKKQMLCQRATEHVTGVSGEMKTFIEGLFSSFKEMVSKDIQERFDKVDTEVAQIKEKLSHMTGPSDIVGKCKDSEILTHSGPVVNDQDKSSQTQGPSTTHGKDQATQRPSATLEKSAAPGSSGTQGKDQAKSSQSPRPSAGKGRGKAAENVNPVLVRRSPRTVRKVTTT